MTHVAVGDVCFAGRTNRLALVIFLREPSEGRPEDVRVVPLAFASAAPPASERDVLIPATATFLGGALLAESWNTRSLVSEMLSIPLARVESRFVEAVRAAEMIGIAPTVDLAGFAELMGHRQSSDAVLDQIANFEDGEVDTWNEIEAESLRASASSRGTRTYGKDMYRPKKALGAPITVGISNAMTTIELVSLPYPMVALPQWFVAEPACEYEQFSIADAA